MRPGEVLRRLFFVPAFAAYPILHIAVVNPGQIPLQSIVMATILAVFAALLATALLRSVSRNLSNGAIAAALLIALFFLYGPLNTRFEEQLLELGEKGDGSNEELTSRLHLWMTIGWSVIAVAGSWLICRVWQRPPERFISALNVVAAVLLVFVAVELGLTLFGGNDSKFTAKDTHATGLSTSVLGYNPDIYYIILDGYARADVLKREYGFDNSTFIDEMRERGFRVNTGSFANYYWTFLSLSSSLNMDYLQDLFGAALEPQSKDRTLLYDAIRDNAVARFLRERGYRFVHFQSSWGATLFNPYADAQIRCHGGIFQQEFYRALAEASWLKVLQSRAGGDLAECHLSNLRNLATIAPDPGPKFVFAHFLPPHHPYLFDREGHILRRATLSNQFEFHKRLWEKRTAYIEQLEFMNGRIIEALDSILRTSRQPPVIIVQSDHGPQLTVGLDDVGRKRVRLANFAAFLLPGTPDSLIPPDLAPVNEFRAVLSYYFRADLPSLPARHYYSGFSQPYSFEPVDVIAGKP
jgi:hypothetical protein